MAEVPPEGVPAEQWMRVLGSGDGNEVVEKLMDEYDKLEDMENLGKSSECLGSSDGNKFPTLAYGVQGEGTTSYVAIAGPTTATMVQFYTLVQEKKVGGIAMLNGLDKINNEPSDKYPQYWPVEKGEEMVIGPWTVRCEKSYLKGTGLVNDTQTVKDVAQALCRVTHLWISGPDSKTRRLMHVCHNKWKDGLLPETATGRTGPENVTQLVELMTDEHSLARASGPLLVHCFGGVGRTGTAIVLDLCAARLMRTQKADVFETVKFVRRQRPNAVAGAFQYVYLNLAMAQLVLERLARHKHPGVFKHEKEFKKTLKKCWEVMRSRMVGE